MNLRIAVRLAGTVGLAAVLALLTSPMLRADTTIFSYPFSGTVGDQIDRGFYISNYPGNNLSMVTLAYAASTAGSYTIQLTARLSTYDGTIIGSAQNQTATLPLVGSGTETQVTFNFGGAPVTPGSTVTFTQTLVSGPGTVFFDVGAASGPAGITETNGTTPPLDTSRRASVGVVITEQSAPPGTPAPPTWALTLMGMALVAMYYGQKHLRTRNT